MEEGFLWGYVEGEPVSEEALYTYAATLPLLVEYLADEFVAAHVPERRKPAAIADLRLRLEELVRDARFCHGTAVPLAVGTWYLRKWKHSWTRGAADLRSRGKKIAETEVPLFAQYEEIRSRLKTFLPRRTDHAPISAGAFRRLKRAFPEIPWRSRTKTIDQTPATVARLILSVRVGRTPKGIEKAVRDSRKEWERAVRRSHWE